VKTIEEITECTTRKIEDTISKSRREISKLDLIPIFDGLILDMTARIIAGILFRIKKKHRKQIMDQFIDSVYAFEEQVVYKSKGGEE